ncbi:MULTISPECIES: hypothetical protein [unclassified Pasteurella]|uniref:hypothetical protein n=1 Tax=unclassified Pasteurella TaxID=2621516 RepID=UPI001431D1D7|nr:hypothetical protein [Pasteurella sp. 19428wF3_WM03]
MIFCLVLTIKNAPIYTARRVIWTADRNRVPFACRATLILFGENIEFLLGFH